MNWIVICVAVVEYSVFSHMMEKMIFRSLICCES